MNQKIQSINGFEILDSRGNPTVMAEVTLNDGSKGVASIPSGASTGMFEARELRDFNDQRYFGKGVLRAIENINNIIAPTLLKLGTFDQAIVDKTLIELDGTRDKQKLGANAILAVSLAVARAAAKHFDIPLYRYLGGINAYKLPIPMMNILNGGMHSSNNIDIQEFMIVPIGAKNFSEGLRWCSEIYHTLGSILKNNGFQTSVGDEGGFAPNLTSDEQAIELIISAIQKAQYNTKQVKIALDAASSEWWINGSYSMTKRKITFSSSEMIKYWINLCNKYPIISIEDPMSEQDFGGWQSLTKSLGGSINLVGDDLFVTNAEKLNMGIKQGLANSILIKPNQVGTLTETFETIDNAKSAGFNTIISHRSGETEDTFISDLAVATNAGFIKAGAPCRSDRVAKYNRLLKIESEINWKQKSNRFQNKLPIKRAALTSFGTISNSKTQGQAFLKRGLLVEI